MSFIWAYVLTKRVETFGYESADVVVMKDDGESVSPTKDNIVSGVSIFLEIIIILISCILCLRLIICLNW